MISSQISQSVRLLILRDIWNYRPGLKLGGASISSPNFSWIPSQRKIVSQSGNCLPITRVLDSTQCLIGDDEEAPDQWLTEEEVTKENAGDFLAETFHFTLLFFEGNLLCHLLNPCNVTFPSKLLPNRLKCYWPDLPFVTSGENLEMFPAKTVLKLTM